MNNEKLEVVLANLSSVPAELELAFISTTPLLMASLKIFVTKHQRLLVISTPPRGVKFISAWPQMSEARK